MGSKAGTKRNHTLVHGVKRLWFFAKRNLEYTLLLTIKKLKKPHVYSFFCGFVFYFCDVVFRDKLFVQDEMKGR